ncbi:hypothetical protein TNCV_3166871 [Trichonephila clavipes]|uniref:Uncharacterized protein n=1 Tax=Trichonephila clavipes TaxID=2585209 RepID=A0A8X6USI2_TRICX|nr:hypothetical protein TNCV_3166871 [Trichonephila clavipes]
MEKFRKVMEKRDELIAIQHDFCIGRSTVRLKFHSSNMEIDHKSGARHPVQCNMNHLQQSRSLINVIDTIATF